MVTTEPPLDPEIKAATKKYRMTYPDIMDSGTTLSDFRSIGLTAVLAESCAAVRFEALPAAAIHLAKSAIVDCVGCMLAGADAVAAVRDMVLAEGGARAASIVATPYRVPASAAALVNGAAAHALDYDDVGIAMLGHPSVVIVPALFALAEGGLFSGREIVCAYVAGFEVAAALGKLVNPAHYAAGWHTTCTLGCIAAAGAAARLLGLSQERTEAAFGIAASQSSGLRANFGSDMKPLHAGMAARAGVISALLAHSGMSAGRGVLEGTNGFLRTVCAVSSPVIEAHGFGAEQGYELLASGLSFKLHACCGTAHTSVDGALRIALEHSVEPTSITEVVCTVNRMAPDILIYHEAKSPGEARFCLEYCIAASLIDGACGLAQFDEKRINADDVQSLMRRVNVMVDSALSIARGGLTPSRITIRTATGAEWNQYTEIALGSPGAPAPRALFDQKFAQCTRPVLGERIASEVFDCLNGLDTLTDLRPLIGLLRS